jgi:hypothetical protein
MGRVLSQHVAADRLFLYKAVLVSLGAIAAMAVTVVYRADAKIQPCCGRSPEGGVIALDLKAPCIIALIGSNCGSGKGSLCRRA